VSGYSSVDTFSSLVDEILMSLQGYTVDNDLVCALSAPIVAGDLLIGVDDAEAVSKGIIEIDEELIFVKSNASGNLTIAPFGRGYKGTTATAHSAGAKVSVSPTYPRSIVSREVNNTIRAVYPDLFAVATTDITMDGINWQYGLPADLDRVLLVETRWTIEAGWTPIREWDVTHSANTTDYATGKFLSIGEPLAAGMIVHVTYAKPPNLLANPTDLFTATGLPASARDVIVYGTASRLLPWLDTGRVPVETVAADLADQNKPVGNAVSLARELRTLYAARLASEKSALRERYPIKSRRVR
jgi:hypothetical protein